MFMITTLVVLACLIFYIQISSRIKSGRTLNKIQTNMVNNYVNVSRKLGVSTYKWLGIAFLALLTIQAFNIDAWLSAIIFVAYTFFSTRAHTLIRATTFVNENGLLKPVKSETVVAAAPAAAG